MCDETERAIQSFDRMIRLSPLDPLRISAWDGAAHALFSLERYEEGCVAAMKAMQFNVNAHTLGALILLLYAVRAGRTRKPRRKRSAGS